MEASPCVGSPVKLSLEDTLGSPYWSVLPPVYDKIWKAKINEISRKQVFPLTESKSYNPP